MPYRPGRDCSYTGANFRLSHTALFQGRRSGREKTSEVRGTGRSSEVGFWKLFVTTTFLLSFPAIGLVSRRLLQPIFSALVRGTRHFRGSRPVPITATNVAMLSGECRNPVAPGLNYISGHPQAPFVCGARLIVKRQITAMYPSGFTLRKYLFKEIFTPSQ